MSYTMYTPLNVWLDPASITDVVAYIQTYLSENTIYSETEIETIIHDYLIAHPELIGGVQSVNGKTGTVVLSASDINTENNVTIESVLTSLSSQISSIAASVATNTANITNLTGRITTAETDLTNLKSKINDIVTVFYSPNLYNPDDINVLQDTYINPNGTVETVSGRTVSGFIPVTPGYKIVFSRDINGIQTEQTFNASCYYNSSKQVVSGGSYNSNKQTVPANAAYVRVTFGTSYVNPMIECNADGTVSPYEPYVENRTELNENITLPTKTVNDTLSLPDGFRWNGSINAGNVIKLPVSNVKNQQVFAFSGNISTFSKISIGRIFTNGDTYGAFDIDATNVVFHCDNGIDETLTHGLTITNNIQFVITTENTYNLSGAYLISNGVIYDVFANLSDKRFVGDEGAPFVSSTGSTLTNCSFSWTSRNINKPVWMFGDSYMSLYTTRWTYYLVQNGYDKSCIINARSGEASAEALTSLRNLLTLRSKPKFLLWALGINEGDGTAVNSNWKTAYDAVVEICNENGIIPIFATIPNTPNIDNTFKNAIVKNSGYRFIDFASAVGANSQGSTWFTGMLSTDNVHPTENGALSLYAQAITDLPELTSL